MIKVSALLWSFLAALIVAGISYFYLSTTGGHGFPFHFAQEATKSASAVIQNDSVIYQKVAFNYWLFAFDLIFWWLLFSILLVVIKNYVFERN